jgi:ATP-dependent helicase/nuclease subunit A
MADKRIEWTEQQIRAIEARGSDVLVTASAGTGKTAVLSRRCAGIISDKSICPDVRCLLVLTFTDAAAEQMRSRIAEQLRQAYLEKRDSHLRRQLVLLQGADISTIHAFCKRLITEHFYKLDLDPTFGVIDGDEQKLLKSETLDKTLDKVWRQDDIRAGLERLLYRRDLRPNEGFISKIIQISDFLDGVISRENWHRRAAKLAEAANSIASETGQRQRRIVQERLKRILGQLEHARKLCQNEGGDSGWIEKMQASHIAPITRCIEVLNAGDWDKCSETIRNFTKPKTYKPKDLSEPVAAMVQKTVKDALDSFEKLSQFAIVNPDYLDRLGEAARGQTSVLIKLVKVFDRLYSEAKRTLDCLDFADLEHYALRLLTAEDSDEACPERSRGDEPAPSETALALRQQYKYIFVDEYQDINPVQQQILRMLSAGDNVLGVGDGKQSIYAFRGAQPDIFLERVELASHDPSPPPLGLRVDLNVNFRSTARILEFVNAVFTRIMTRSFTKIDYDESALLKPGLAEQTGSIQDDGQNIIEFHIIDEEKADSSGTNDQEPDPQDEPAAISNRQRQAAMIARRIRRMVGADTGKAEFQIYDKQQDVLRDVRYSDIVVLMRSLAKKANEYVEIFRLAGVPVSCQSTAGYFEATEISDMLCLLKVLDNPRRDIELAALLRSPLFKVGDTDLAKMRLNGKENSDYYDSVLDYTETGDDQGLVLRLKNILARIDRWRTIARRGNLADLIWQIYRETAYLSFVTALPSGQARRANLLKLHDRAIQFEGFASSAGIPSLSRFVEFVEKLQAVGQDWAPAEPAASAGNAVRILSIHKSKGLEFSVVFLADLQSKFNKSDSQGECLADAESAEGGLGLQIIDRDSNSRLSSPEHEVIAERKEATALAEEMRVLYVAVTRAKNRLILTASQKLKDCRQMVTGGFFFGEETIPDWRLRSCSSPLEWILCGLSNRKVLHDALQTGLSDRAVGDDLFSFKLHQQPDLVELDKFVTQLRDRKSDRSGKKTKKSRPKSTESQLLAPVKKSLAWRYRFGDALLLPAKSSVTQLTHANDEYFNFDYAGALERQPRALAVAGPSTGREPDARLIGTATHLVISEIDLTEPIRKETVEQTKQRLIADDAIPPGVAEHIDSDSIVGFFASNLGGLALNAANTVWREWPFTFALPVAEASDETMVIQGIIDMLIRTPESLVVVDFKTDNIAAGQAVERAELYRKQLEFYGKAACAILGVDSVRRWLYFLMPRRPVEV